MTSFEVCSFNAEKGLKRCGVLAKTLVIQSGGLAKVAERSRAFSNLLSRISVHIHVNTTKQVQILPSFKF